ncbi:MAG TPA: BatA domain-containing protein, partial [Gemmataceae bacterium]|nr:BatA domain-containing protein [Gemmataceae bacterium]
MATRWFNPRPASRGVWFPVALGALLLLALPGAVLLALALFGRQNAVNGWMQGHWGLSYHLPVPWWAGLLLLLVPPLLILLYFLRLKRKPLKVPSTFLWRKSIEDLHVNSLFQWLRDNVL